MKKIKQLFLISMVTFGMWFFSGVQAEASVVVDETNFPDETVRRYATSRDTNKDGVLSDEELQAPTKFVWNVNNAFGVKAGGVVDFKGMNQFSNIKEVSFYNVGTGKGRWNYSDSDLFQYFPNATSMELHAYRGSTADGGAILTLSGTAKQLNKITVTASKVQWDVKAENLKELSIGATIIAKSKITSEGLPSLDKLSLRSSRLQENELAIAGLSSLRDLTLQSMNVQELEKNGFSLSKLPLLKLKSLTIHNMNIKNSGFTLEGMSLLESLNLAGSEYGELNLNPVKKTLKTLYIGAEKLGGEEYACSFPSVSNTSLKKLDISQMECLESLYASYTELEKLITKDASGKSNTKQLKRLHLWHSNIKSLDLSAMPALEELYAEGSFSKMVVSKNKKLKTLYVKSDKLKSISLKKNGKLDDLHIDGKKIKNLDLSKNTSLRNMYLGKNIRLKKLVLPMLKKSVKWGNQTSYTYVCNKKCKIGTLDISRIKKFTKKSKRTQMCILQYKKNYKKVIVSKKLSKSNRNWIKKQAKRAKAKVVVR